LEQQGTRLSLATIECRTGGAGDFGVADDRFAIERDGDETAGERHVECLPLVGLARRGLIRREKAVDRAERLHRHPHGYCGVHVIQTDNGAEFQSRFHWHLEALDIRHVYIRPRTPRLNGKVERSHRVDDREFYQLLDKNGVADDIRLFNEKLREWEDYYNYHRPHGALAGQTPYERLLAKTNPAVSPNS
jgi:transposase InsO family protein